MSFLFCCDSTLPGSLWATTGCQEWRFCSTSRTSLRSQTLWSGGGQQNVQSTKPWIILVHYSNTWALLQSQTDQKLWSPNSGWDRSDGPRECFRSSSCSYASCIYCHFIAITAMDGDPSPYFLRMSVHPFCDLRETLEQPTNDAEDQQFFLLVSRVRCELIENTNKWTLLTQALWEM